VYKGVEKNTTPPKEYAIKVIEKGKLTEEEIHFLANETEIFKFLNHPGIIKVQETHENRTHIYIIAELVNDGDLFDYVVKKEFLEEYEVSLIMK
jgi:serine/threonine protein kinase